MYWFLNDDSEYYKCDGTFKEFAYLVELLEVQDNGDFLVLFRGKEQVFEASYWSYEVVPDDRQEECRQKFLASEASFVTHEHLTLLERRKMMNANDSVQVARGAAFLDRVRPGWATKINPEYLNIQVCELCIIGQLFGADFTSMMPFVYRLAANLPENYAVNFWKLVSNDERTEILTLWSTDVYRFAQAHGFFTLSTKGWLDAIKERVR